MKRASRLLIIFFFLTGYLFSASVRAEEWSPEQIKKLINEYKEDRRGPYQGIRWFCPDGTVNPAKVPCGDKGGIQHALHKKSAVQLADNNGIYLGQILAGQPVEDFWDEKNHNERLKQYMLEKYLRAADKGWILRKAQYYRGAVQVEDEQEWGKTFLRQMLQKDERIQSRFFLLHQAVKTIPHRKTGYRWEQIRALSKSIGEVYPKFTDLRVKLHGRPEPADTDRVTSFYNAHQQQMPKSIQTDMATLISELGIAFSPRQAEIIKANIWRLPKSLPLTKRLAEQLKRYEETDGTESFDVRYPVLAEMLVDIRRHITEKTSPKHRLTLMDISVDLETLLFREISQWRPSGPAELFFKSYTLTRAAAGCGFLELWEWDAIQSELMPKPEQEDDADTISIQQFMAKADAFSRITAWGTGMVRTTFTPVIKKFGEFEPLANGFIDDRIRASVMLPLGNAAGRLADISAWLAGGSHLVMGIDGQNRIRGVNPGIAKGELVVVTGNPGQTSFKGDKIYALSRPPADMKPVAGIAAVTEGNRVSHLQLLARNLGIPNAVITPDHLTALSQFSGREVFYAVSPRGRVIMKPAEQMSEREKKLADKKTRSDQRVMVPVDRVDLTATALISMKDLRSTDSGRVCGPKAANLGQLKHWFPDHVCDGLVIPFGVFRNHMDQPMPGASATYWQYLTDTFKQADAARTAGTTEPEIEAATLSRLSTLRKAMKTLPLMPDFRKQVETRFKAEFGKPLGQLPVFIRSDTNMEDLKEFTGAGLNKTVFNVRGNKKFWQGIRDVWASPFRERGYLWRQKFMRNPKNVYPSILILPTVFVDSSGVMITTDIAGNNPDAVTVAFSRGPGGAVEGQAAETYLIQPDNRFELTSPSREHRYNVLYKKGGGKKGYRFFHQRILTPDKIRELNRFSGVIRRTMKLTPGMENSGPWDVELGFEGDKVWLFQIRPYVENKQAKGSFYLQSLDPVIPGDKRVRVDRWKSGE